MKVSEEPREMRPRHAQHGGSGLRDRVVIGVTVVAVSAFLLLGIPLLRHSSPTEREIINPVVEPTRDADREAVREWLRRNVSDPHPRELCWWPAREMVEIHRQRLAAAKAEMEDDPNQEDVVEQLEHDGPDRICRLKYRTQNDVGAQVSADDLFTIRQGRARLLRKDSWTDKTARTYFPEAAGVP